MKKIIILVFLFFLIFHPAKTFAHFGGQPVLKVNGEYTQQYPVPFTAIPQVLEIPQDNAPTVYLANESLDFALDADRLPIVKEQLPAVRFIWDFGDGTTDEGLEVTHRYAKTGSYMIKIFANTSAISDSTDNQLFQTMMLHIIPSKSYQLPKAIIAANGKKSADPLVDTQTMSFIRPIHFDAGDSESTSAITQYIWDFGDGESGRTKQQSHQYNMNDFERVFVVLRIVNKDGFIADSFMQIDNAKFAPQEEQEKKSDYPILLAIAGVLLLLSALIILSRKRRK